MRLLALCFAFCFLFSCHSEKTKKMPLPTNGIDIYHAHLDGEEEHGNARQEWIEMSHRAAPGTDWRAADDRTRQQLLDYKNTLGSRVSETFADGQVAGTWSERGSQNQAGSLVAIDYEADQDKIYGIAAGGPLVRGNLNGTGWEVLEDDLRFEPGILQVVPFGGGKRILAARGKQIWYSDDLGGTWTQSTGLNFYDNWGHAKQLVALNNGTSIYYLAFTWNQNPWGSRMWLLHSTNSGQSFSLIKVFEQNGNYWDARNYTGIWSPSGTNELYAFHTSGGAGVAGTYSVSGATVTLLNGLSGVPANSQVSFHGYKSGATTNLYSLVASNTLYKSSNTGASWATVGGTLPANAWDVGVFASPFDVNKIFFGAVNCFRSYNQGVSWTEVNGWAQYYGNTNYLHADIMRIGAFEKTNGTKFLLVSNHGGLHVSYDHLTTTTNIGTSGLNISQYYDVRTDPTNANYIYAGAQDQGHQRTNLGGNAGPVNFTQVISGDYGHMAFSQNGSRLWTVYPGGWVTYYANPKTSGYTDDFDVLGTDEPVSGWIYPTAEVANVADNKIYVAGGNMSGGSGSYLIQLTGGTSISYTQLGFDFKASSGGTISAIEASTVNTSRLFVGTSNGKFYYSNNSGSTWTQTSSFTGPGEHWLYGSSILASKLDANLVWFAGSGYSNPAVYKSTNGGVTFTAISIGLPSTLVHEIVANTDETLLFAATEVGPYVYVVAANQWYPLIGALTPLQEYYSVEYVASGDIVRFGTYGRGIFDFAVSNEPIPLDWLAFEAKMMSGRQVALHWETANEKDNSHFEIERSADGRQFSSFANMPAKGNAAAVATYELLDNQPFPGTSYYRLRQIDLDGKESFSPVRSVTLPDAAVAMSVSPNPAVDGRFSVYFEKTDGQVSVKVWDLQGRLLVRKTVDGRNSVAQITLSDAVGGVVLVEVEKGGEREVRKVLVER